MPNTDLCFLNVTELAPLVRAHKISPVEIVQALLSRIDALNDDLLAYLNVSAAQAMAAAQAAELEIGSGGYRGPLHEDYGWLRSARGLHRCRAPAARWCHLPRQAQYYRIRLRQHGGVWHSA